MPCILSHEVSGFGVALHRFPDLSRQHRRFKCTVQADRLQERFPTPDCQFPLSAGRSTSSGTLLFAALPSRMPGRLFWRILSLRSRFVCQTALSFHCLPITSPSFVLLLFLSTQKDTQHCQMSSCGKCSILLRKDSYMSPSGKSEQKDSNLRPCLLMRLLSPLSYVPMLPGC